MAKKKEIPERQHIPSAEALATMPATTPVEQTAVEEQPVQQTAVQPEQPINTPAVKEKTPAVEQSKINEWFTIKQPEVTAGVPAATPDAAVTAETETEKDKTEPQTVTVPEPEEPAVASVSGDDLELEGYDEVAERKQDLDDAKTELASKYDELSRTNDYDTRQRLMRDIDTLHGTIETLSGKYYDSVYNRLDDEQREVIDALNERRANISPSTITKYVDEAEREIAYERALLASGKEDDSRRRARRHIAAISDILQGIANMFAAARGATSAKLTSGSAAVAKQELAEDKLREKRLAQKASEWARRLESARRSDSRLAEVLTRQSYAEIESLIRTARAAFRDTRSRYKTEQTRETASNRGARSRNTTQMNTERNTETRKNNSKELVLYKSAHRAPKKGKSGKGKGKTQVNPSAASYNFNGQSK